MGGDAREIVRVRVVVTGRVQGVFFRALTAERARAARVAGWVANRSDGAVEAEFQGPRPAVDAVVAWCRTGPPAARVDDVGLWTIETVPTETDFRVLH